MSFNPGFNISAPQMSFNLPSGFGAGVGAAATAASGFNPLGMLLGLGGSLLNFGLSQFSSRQSYDRQKELMSLSQDYNSEEAVKQRQMSSMSHLRSELHRLGLNPDLIYQQGASQGSMSNAVGAGAPSVMPANVPTFDGLLQGLQTSAQMMNAETNAKVADAEISVKSATVDKLYNEVNLVREQVKSLDWDNIRKSMESEFWYENAKNLCEKYFHDASLTAEQASTAQYTSMRLLAQLYADFGAEVRGFGSASGPIPFDLDTYNKVFGTNYTPNATFDNAIKRLSRDLIDGQVDIQNIDKYFKELDKKVSDWTGLSPDMTKEVVRALSGLLDAILDFIPVKKGGKLIKSVSEGPKGKTTTTTTIN